jgi:hypothetical protein
VKLTPHFSLEELTQSQTAARLGLDNTPTARVLENLQHTADRMEEVRELLGGRSILVSSGFRSQKVNDAVGGALTSQHRYGLAADFTCHSYGSPRDIVKAIARSPLRFDQLILEFDRWVHVSFVRNDPRRQVLAIGTTL